MNSKVVFWINDDLSTLGLVNTLKTKHDFDDYKEEFNKFGYNVVKSMR